MSDALDAATAMGAFRLLALACLPALALAGCVAGGRISLAPTLGTDGTAGAELRFSGGWGLGRPEKNVMVTGTIGAAVVGTGATPVLAVGLEVESTLTQEFRIEFGGGIAHRTFFLPTQNISWNGVSAWFNVYPSRVRCRRGQYCFVGAGFRAEVLGGDGVLGVFAIPISFLFLDYTNPL